MMMTRQQAPEVAAHRLRVFTDEAGLGGNLLGVLLPESAVPIEDRGNLASRLGYPELVFVNDISRGELEIYGHDGRPMPFAGHPLVGAGWLLAGLLRRDIVSLVPPAGAICSWRDHDGVQWIKAEPEYGPQVTLIEYAHPEQVDRLQGAPFGVDFAYCWAWEDHLRYAVRARCFAPGHGVVEDEATGGAAIRLVEALDRPLAIRQGQGSVLYAKPRGDGRVALGGRVVRDGQNGVDQSMRDGTNGPATEREVGT